MFARIAPLFADARRRKSTVLVQVSHCFFLLPFVPERLYAATAPRNGHKWRFYWTSQINCHHVILATLATVKCCCCVIDVDVCAGGLRGQRFFLWLIVWWQQCCRESTRTGREQEPNSWNPNGTVGEPGCCAGQREGGWMQAKAVCWVLGQLTEVGNPTDWHASLGCMLFCLLVLSLLWTQ